MINFLRPSTFSSNDGGDVFLLSGAAVIWLFEYLTSFERRI